VGGSSADGAAGGFHDYSLARWDAMRAVEAAGRLVEARDAWSEAGIDVNNVSYVLRESALYIGRPW
jgi:hypothetical protein